MFARRRRVYSLHFVRYTGRIVETVRLLLRPRNLNPRPHRYLHRSLRRCHRPCRLQSLTQCCHPKSLRHRPILARRTRKCLL